jgi:hypothetical protein
VAHISRYCARFKQPEKSDEPWVSLLIVSKGFTAQRRFRSSTQSGSSLLSIVTGQREWILAVYTSSKPPEKNDEHVHVQSGFFLDSNGCGKMFQAHGAQVQDFSDDVSGKAK